MTERELGSIDTSVEGTSVESVARSLDAWQTELGHQLRSWTGAPLPKTVRGCSGTKVVDARPSWACSRSFASVPPSSVRLSFERTIEPSAEGFRGYGRATFTLEPS